MIIPIGHEKTVRRFPWVAIFIILTNTIIFFVSWPVMIHQINKIEELREEKFVLERNRSLGHYLYDAEEQIVLAEDDPDYERWSEIERELEHAEANLLYNKYGYTPSNFRWYTLFTSLFFHAGIFHLIGNMWFLYLVGASIEDIWGRRYFLILYLGSGVLACLLHGSIYSTSGVPVIGASGAIAGLMGAFMIRNYKIRMKFFYFFLIFIYPLYGTFYLPAYVALGGWFVMQLLFGTMLLGTAAGVAYWAHVGGFLVGVVVAILFKTQKFEETHIAPKIERDLEAVRLHPHLLQAFAARDRGNLDAASGLLEELIVLEPNNIDAHVELVNIYVSRGDLKNAGVGYDRILTTLARANEADSMTEVCKDIVQLGVVNELSPQNQFRMAVTFSEREMYEEAVDIYRNLLRNHPDDEIAPLSVFKCALLLLHKLNKSRLAHAAFQYILEKYPDIDWKDEVLAQMSNAAPVGR